MKSDEKIFVLLNRFMGGAGNAEPMVRLLSRELAAAPVLEGSDRSALQCHVLLRGQFQPFYGSLSYTDDGMLKMMTPSKITHEGQPEKSVMLEHFFHVYDVTSVMFEREIKVERSLIVGLS